MKVPPPLCFYNFLIYILKDTNALKSIFLLLFMKKRENNGNGFSFMNLDEYFHAKELEVKVLQIALYSEER